MSVIDLTDTEPAVQAVASKLWELREVVSIIDALVERDLAKGGGTTLAREIDQLLGERGGPTREYLRTPRTKTVNKRRVPVVNVTVASPVPATPPAPVAAPAGRRGPESIGGLTGGQIELLEFLRAGGDLCDLDVSKIVIDSRMATICHALGLSRDAEPALVVKRAIAAGFLTK